MQTANNDLGTEKVKALLLNSKHINDPVLLKQWDAIWSSVNEMRVAINFARQSAKEITVDMMYKYEQARNAERQFFWDNFYDQNDTNA
jgi:hypothetical protein